MDFLHNSGVWVLFSFLIFAYVAWSKGRGALLGKLDARIAEIKREIDTASSLRIEAQDLLAQYQRKQRDAAKEAQTIVATAQKHAEDIKRQMEAELSETAKRREQQLQDRLRRMEEAAMADIRAYAAELAVKATAEIIAEKMDEKTNARLVDDSIKQVAGQLN